MNKYKISISHSWNDLFTWLTKLCGCTPSSTLPSAKAALSRLNKRRADLQVAIDEGTLMAVLDLQDESGIFLTLQAEDLLDSEHAGDTVESEYKISEEDDDKESIYSLKQALEEANQ